MQRLMICWEAGVWLFLSYSFYCYFSSFHFSFSFAHTALSSISFLSHLLPLVFLLDPDCSTPTRDAILIENEDQNLVLYTET